MDERDDGDSPGVYQVGQRVLVKLNDPTIRQKLGVSDNAPLSQLATIVAPPQATKLPGGFILYFYGVNFVGRTTPWAVGLTTPQDYFLAHESDMRPYGPAPICMLGEWSMIEHLAPHVRAVLPPVQCVGSVLLSLLEDTTRKHGMPAWLRAVQAANTLMGVTQTDKLPRHLSRRYIEILRAEVQLNER
jgi:hypothetical protein